MNKKIKAWVEAKKEMQQERDRIMRRQKKIPSFLDQEAEKWLAQRSLEEGGQKKELAEKALQQAHSTHSTHSIYSVQASSVQASSGPAKEEIEVEPESPTVSLESIIQEKKQKTAAEIEEKNFDWKQYRPFQEKEKIPKEQKRINSASICMLARKIRAKEWARALGKRGKDPKLEALENEANEFKKTMEDKAKAHFKSPMGGKKGKK